MSCPAAIHAEDWRLSQGMTEIDTDSLFMRSIEHHAPRTESIYKKPSSPTICKVEVAHAWQMYALDNTGLNAALDDLKDIVEEAKEDNFPVPSNSVIKTSEELVRKLFNIYPRRFEVYPSQGGEIAIDIHNGKGSSVIILCGPSGGALCLVNINGNSRRAHYSQVNILPDGFVKEALEEL